MDRFHLRPQMAAPSASIASQDTGSIEAQAARGPSVEEFSASAQTAASERAGRHGAAALKYVAPITLALLQRPGRVEQLIKVALDAARIVHGAVSGGDLQDGREAWIFSQCLEHCSRMTAKQWAHHGQVSAKAISDHLLDGWKAVANIDNGAAAHSQNEHPALASIISAADLNRVLSRGGWEGESMSAASAMLLQEINRGADQLSSVTNVLFATEGSKAVWQSAMKKCAEIMCVLVTKHLEDDDLDNLVPSFRANVALMQSHVSILHAGMRSHLSAQEREATVARTQPGNSRGTKP